MGHFFGYQILHEDEGLEHMSLKDALPVASLSSKGSPSQLRLFATTSHCPQTARSEENGAYIYLWGAPAHPTVAKSALATWCVDVVAKQCYVRFRELLGSFALIVDEPQQNRLTFVSDVLGIRPLFLGKLRDRFVFGSEVWPMQEAGLIQGTIDYNAVSAWIAYRYNCTSGSLFTELSRVAPGSAIVVQDGQCREISYAKFVPESSSLPSVQVVEEVQSIVSSAMKILLSETSRACLALSGGYDSRYLLALAVSLKAPEALSVVTVATDEEERRIAAEVAKRLNVPVQELAVESSVWDLYDSVYHFTADGFPVSKFVTYCIAQQFPQAPMINGFMGDSLVRGSKDQFLGKYETEWKENLVDILQRKHLATSFDLFQPESGGRIRERSRLPMEKAVNEGARLGKVFGWADFYYRQRCYISNNFLQHLDLSEALLPFYSWPLLSYKLGHEYRNFGVNVYSGIFQKFFPSLANIPHAADQVSRRTVSTKVARWTKRWARQLLPLLLRKGWLSLLAKKRCALLAGAGLVGDVRAESAIFTIERLYLLEERIRAANLAFDWEAI